jgi:signal transduction histidine kinase
VPELSTVLSAGWPAGVGVGLALAGERLRTSRRRAALNRAMHELRRPLQALSLVTSRLDDRGRGAGTAVVTRESVDAALTALAELDREINRLPPEPSPRPVAAAALVHGAVERWRGAAAARGRALSVDCRLGGARVLADPRHLERALDNLIANSLEHGTLRVVLRATVGRRGVRIAVGDGGPAPIRRRRRRDPRRGHGLRIVGRIAREHGGRFLLDRSPAGTEAVLELPTIAEAAPPGLRAGAREPAA